MTHGDPAERVRPRATSELFTEHRPYSAKQREVLDALRAHPGGISVAELSANLGMHANTVRGHLDELADRGAIHVENAPIHGRGRPTKLFASRVPDAAEIAREYLSLIEIMAEQLAATTDAPEELSAAAHRIGERWARRMRVADEGGRLGAVQAFQRLIQRLRQLGFDPAVLPESAAATTGSNPAPTAGAGPTAAGDSEAPAGAAGTGRPATATGPGGTSATPLSPTPLPEHRVELRTCPFVAEDGTVSPVICAVHEGFLAEYFGATAPVRPRLRPPEGNTSCMLSVLPAAR